MKKALSIFFYNNATGPWFLIKNNISSKYGFFNENEVLNFLNFRLNSALKYNLTISYCLASTELEQFNTQCNMMY